MSKVLTKAKIALAKMLKIDFGKTPTDQGELQHDGDVIAQGDEVFVADPDGNLVPAPDGEYKNTNDETTYVVVGGIVTEIKEAEAPAEGGEEMAEENPAEGGEEKPDESADMKELLGIVKELVAEVQTLSEEIAKMRDDASELHKQSKKVAAALKLPVEEPASSKHKKEAPKETDVAARFFGAGRK